VGQHSQPSSSHQLCTLANCTTHSAPPLHLHLSTTSSVPLHLCNSASPLHTSLPLHYLCCTSTSTLLHHICTFTSSPLKPCTSAQPLIHLCTCCSISHLCTISLPLYTSSSAYLYLTAILPLYTSAPLHLSPLHLLYTSAPLHLALLAPAPPIMHKSLHLCTTSAPTLHLFTPCTSAPPLLPMNICTTSALHHLCVSPPVHLCTSAPAPLHLCTAFRLCTTSATASLHQHQLNCILAANLSEIQRQ
jgi:hypothetical protein